MPRSRRFVPVPSDPEDPAAAPAAGGPEEHSLSHFDVPAETTRVPPGPDATRRDSLAARADSIPFRL